MWAAAIMQGFGTYQQIQGERMQGEGAKLSSKAAREAGRARNVVAQFEAEEMRTLAGQALAVSQREAMEERRAARLAQSRAIAVAAAGGGTATDTTVLNITGKLEAEGFYNAGVKLYEGESQARSLRLSAEARSYEGRMAEYIGGLSAEAYMDLARAHAYGARATLFGSGSSMVGRYGS